MSASPREKGSGASLTKTSEIRGGYFAFVAPSAFHALSATAAGSEFALALGLHRLTLFLVQLAVAVFVELLEHFGAVLNRGVAVLFLELLAGFHPGLLLRGVEFAVAVLVEVVPAEFRHLAHPLGTLGSLGLQRLGLFRVEFAVAVLIELRLETLLVLGLALFDLGLVGLPHGLALILAEFSVAVLVELLLELNLTRGMHLLAFFRTELSVAVLVEFLQDRFMWRTLARRQEGCILAPFRLGCLLSLKRSREQQHGRKTDSFHFVFPFIVVVFLRAGGHRVHGIAVTQTENAYTGHLLPRIRENSHVPDLQGSSEASLGIRQSPRGERLIEPTFGPSGRQERLNCWRKKRRMKISSQASSCSGV